MISPDKIKRLPGPILVLGASGFVGAGLLRSLLKYRNDVFGTCSKQPAWRLEDLRKGNIASDHVIEIDLNVAANVKALVNETKYRTIFDCVAYGAYSFQEDLNLIYETNLTRTVILTNDLKKQDCRYIHAGTSSEYGDHSDGPLESDALTPNSHYAITKAAVANLLAYLGKKEKFPCANLRLYAVYGPLEDASRLIPTLVRQALSGNYPPFASPETSRDFVYIDDVVAAFVDTALNLTSEDFGESFNVGSGVKTTLQSLAQTTKEVFQLSAEPKFSEYSNRKWDTPDWFSNSEKIKSRLHWQATTPLASGLKQTAEWMKSLPDLNLYERASKKYALDTKRSISAIVACYKDGEAIPIMHRELVKVFEKLKVDYEIIFVNDNSPDDSEAVIQNISRLDRHVIGISHSRNFGSQSAFRSGMEISTKNSVVLLDGDLQDPPEIIEAFYEKWKAGFDVVYGRRIRRVAPFYMQVAYKAFYYFFNRFSYLKIPRDAGDFSLIDRKVVQCLLQFPERDLFLRGIRAFAGFSQTGVDYVRPERRFGRSTNNLFKNIGWAKKGILSFSNFPLNALSFLGVVMFGVSILMMIAQIAFRLLRHELSPRGMTTVIVTVIFFGSLNLFSLSLMGEYLAKIFEEVKRRPHFIRRSIVQNGVIRNASGPAQIQGEN